MTDATRIGKNVWFGRFRRIHMPTKRTFKMICLHLQDPLRQTESQVVSWFARNPEHDWCTMFQWMWHTAIALTVTARNRVVRQKCRGFPELGCVRQEAVARDRLRSAPS